MKNSQIDNFTWLDICINDNAESVHKWLELANASSKTEIAVTYMGIRKEFTLLDFLHRLEFEGV